MKSLSFLVLFSTAVVRASGFQPLWSFLGPDGVNERIAIGTGGTIYGTCALLAAFPGDTGTGAVFALNPNGTKKWEVDVPDAGMNGPVLAPDGTVYASALSLKTNPVTLMALKDGVVRWRLSFDGATRDGTFSRPGCPALAADGTI